MLLVKTLNNISCKEYCNIHKFKYSVLKKELPQKVYIPNYIDNPTVINHIMDVKFPEIYISTLDNVSLIGANYIIFDDDNYCIYDQPFMDYENKINLTVHNTFDVNRNSTSIRYTDSFEIIEEGIMLISGYSFNYSHFQLEVASKLCVIDEIKEYNNIPIIIDEICLATPQFQEELELLNKQGRKIIPLKKGYSYKVKKLIHIKDLAIYPANIKKGCLLKYEDVVINELGVKLLNKNLSIKSNIYRKLFISRRKTVASRLQNQDIVEQIFKEFGYEIIFPEEMSFHDQLKIFSEADFIAGASGAGLTNIIFANKNAKIIFIQPKAIESTWYSNIAGILELKSYFLDGALFRYPNVPYYQNGFIVNEEYLRKFLNGLVLTK